MLNHRLLLVAIKLLCIVKFTEECALPYWWIQEYSLPPSTLQSVQPKTSFRYRETLQVFDPHNFVHVKEYAEYSWYDHHENNGITVDKKKVSFPSVKTKTTAKIPFPTTKEETNVPFPTTKDETNVPLPTTLDILEERQGVVTPKPELERNDKEMQIVNDKNDDLTLAEGKADLNDVDILTYDESSKQEKRANSLFDGWFNHKSGLLNETEPCKVSEADIHSLRSMIENMFSFPRDYSVHPESKEKAREDILKKFREFGLQVWTQNFSAPSVPVNGGPEEMKEGVNLIGVIPGTQRGQLDDGIVLVGAHYDTVSDSNGVDDNGSGLAVMMEVAKGLTKARCKFNNTLMFVAFDLEEDGAMGSNFFVDQYLIPEELQRARAHFQGAFILDGIMNFNGSPNSQELPIDYAESLPGLQYFVNNTGNRGDFLAMISRNEIDNHLTQQLMNAWQNLDNHNYKLYNLAVDMGQHIPPPHMIESRLNFLNSDHATFWYHNSSKNFPDTLNAVLLTDTGPFRGQMKNCYHNKCDDLTGMSAEKLQFAKKTSDALTATLVELTRATAGGCCLKENWMMMMMAQFTFVYLLMKVHTH